MSTHALRRADRRLLTTLIGVCGLATAATAQSTEQPPPATASAPANTPEPAPASPVPAPGTIPNPAPAVETVPISYDQPILEGQPPTEISQELNDVSAERTGAIESPTFKGPLVLLREQDVALEKDTGLRLGFAYTMLFQQASGGPGDRSAGGGDLELYAAWTVLGRGTKDTGSINLALEYRNQIGSQTPAELGPEIGTLLKTTNGFNERTFTVKELYWKQTLLDGKFTYGIGRVDPENLFGGHKYQSANNFFLNQAFSTNPTVPYPGSGMAIAAALRPVDWWYVGGGISNANGSTTNITINEFFDEAEFLSFGEIGLTPTIEGMGKGRYRLALWHIDAREEAGVDSNEGFSLIMDQELTPTIGMFARYGYANDSVSVANQIAEAGIVFTGLIGGKDDVTGFAGAWTEPFGDKRDEIELEVFHRIQLTPQTQLTVGAQLILQPSNAPEDDALGVFSCRVRFTF